MAFATKYSVTWDDIEGVEWEIDFQEDGFGGSETTLTSGANPLVMNWNGGEKYQPIVGSSCDIQVVWESAVDSLYDDSETAQAIKVLVIRDSVNMWSGFVSPGQYHYHFNQPKHYATIIATDGLGELKNIMFEDGSGDPYFGQEEEIVVIANILQKTGMQFSIREAVNIFDTNHTTGAAYSPLNQTYIYQEAYWDEQTDERTDCYKVLEDILRKYGATIRYAYDFWHILRPNSYSVDNIYYRTFTYLGVYATNTNFNSYNAIGSSLYYLYVDQELTKKPGIGLCEVTQTPPIRGNIFKNGSFDSFTWTGGIPDYWTDVYSSGTNLDIAESSGTLKMGSSGAAPATPTEYIECTMGLTDISSASITFDFHPVYTGTPSFKDIYVQIYDGAYYLTTSGWQAGVGYYIITVPALGSGLDFKSTIDIPAQFSYGYDRNFDLRFRIYEFHNENLAATNYVLIDNLRLEIGMNVRDTKLHTYDNSYETINNIEKIDIALGDSWVTDYFASETDDDTYFVNTYSAGSDLTTSWQITGDQTAGAPIGEVLARQTVEGFRRSIDNISGTLRSAYMTLPYIGFADSDFTDEYGFDKHFFPLDISLNARLNEWSGSWIECPAIYTDQELNWDDGTVTYDSYILDANEIILDTDPVSGTDIAQSDSYTAAVGEWIRIVAVRSGGGDDPNYDFDGNTGTLPNGTNYLTFRCSTAGAKVFEINNTDGESAAATVTFTLYSLIGI